MAPTFREPGSGKASELASPSGATDPAKIVLENLPFPAVFVPDDSSVPSLNAAARQILPAAATTSVAAIVAALGASRDKLFPVSHTSSMTNSWEAILVGEERCRLSVTASEFRDARAARIGCLLVFQDVTVEKDTTELKTSFASTVAHELRTPLAALKGFVDNLLDGIEGPLTGGQRECLERMTRINKRLLGLLDGLLRLAKLQSGMTPSRREPTDVAGVVGESVLPFQREATEKGIRLTTLVSASLPFIHSDGDRLIQVLTNLISNALKHTPRGGEVIVRAAAMRESTQRAIERLAPRTGPLRASEWVQLSVEDTGEGISGEDIDRVFDPFFQAGARRPGDLGVGLGLAICKEILRGLNGHIFVESRFGQGSHFTVVLPVNPTPAPSSATNGSAGETGTGKEGSHAGLG